jgi:hypothetical protein
MPLQTKPEDLPSAVRFHLNEQGGALEVTCTLVGDASPYRIQGGTPRFDSRNALKTRAEAAGLSPAIAEDTDRSFNATARQLTELGFSVEVEKQQN